MRYVEHFDDFVDASSGSEIGKRCRSNFGDNYRKGILYPLAKHFWENPQRTEKFIPLCNKDDIVGLIKPRNKRTGDRDYIYSVETYLALNDHFTYERFKQFATSDQRVNELLVSSVDKYLNDRIHVKNPFRRDDFDRLPFISYDGYVMLGITGKIISEKMVAVAFIVYYNAWFYEVINADFEYRNLDEDRWIFPEPSESEYKKIMRLNQQYDCGDMVIPYHSNRQHVSSNVRDEVAFLRKLFIDGQREFGLEDMLPISRSTEVVVMDLIDLDEEDERLNHPEPFSLIPWMKRIVSYCFD